jgi:hypothetical protein
VEGFGYSGTLIDIMTVGLSYKFSLDAFLGYQAPIAYYNAGGNNILFTPTFYVEGASHNFIQVSFLMLDFRLNFDFIGLRYDFYSPSYL